MFDTLYHHCSCSLDLLEIRWTSRPAPTFRIFIRIIRMRYLQTGLQTACKSCDPLFSSTPNYVLVCAILYLFELKEQKLALSN